MGSYELPAKASHCPRSRITGLRRSSPLCNLSGDVGKKQITRVTCPGVRTKVHGLLENAAVDATSVTDYALVEKREYGRSWNFQRCFLQWSESVHSLAVSIVRDRSRIPGMFQDPFPA